MTRDQHPMFQVVARGIEDDIVVGALDGGDQIPSWHELSRQYSISPSTASSTTTSLARKGLLERRRGVGLFVSPTAREQLLRERSASFENDYLKPMLTEAHRLRLSLDVVVALIADRNPQVTRISS